MIAPSQAASDRGNNNGAQPPPSKMPKGAAASNEMAHKSRAQWAALLTALLVLCAVNQHRAGNFTDNGFTTAGWNAIADALNEEARCARRKCHDGIHRH